MIIVLFGLAGAGKNYIGERLEQAGLGHFWDADTRLTPDMHHAIATQQLFTSTMRDHYFQDVTHFIKTNFQAIPRLIVAQAFYQNRYRLAFHAHFPKTQWIQIKATPETIKKRLQQRNNAINQAYAEKIEPFFEEPSHPYHVFHNDPHVFSQTSLEALERLIHQFR